MRVTSGIFSDIGSLYLAFGELGMGFDSVYQELGWTLLSERSLLEFRMDLELISERNEISLD